jgi:Uma2 family endonuclease
MSTITSTRATAPPTVLPIAPAVPSEIYRFSIEQYEAMGDAEILTEDDNVELVEGVVYRKPMKKGPHSVACRRAAKSLDRVIPTDVYFVTREDPVAIPGRDSMPEPDISVVRGDSDDYVETQPKAADVPAVVEVASNRARLARDRGDKLTAYAAGRIPIYWIINLLDRQVEVYTRPAKNAYRSQKIFVSGQQVPVVIDGQELASIAVDDLLPPQAAKPKGKGRRK